jgi:hypothetical protein
MKKLGIIQTRGLGDIIIALPIAKFYTDQNYEVYWPICSHWVEQMTATAPYVHWLPVEPDRGPFFWDVPQKILTDLKMDDVLCLYQALTNHPEFTDEPYFQHTSFDKYKYIKAGVPFLNKWRLNECIHRNLDREQQLYNKYVKNPNYIVAHLQSSQQYVNLDLKQITPPDWQIIEIQEDGWVFDWLTIIEKAQSIIMTDSCFANLTDQLNLGDDRYFIPQNHIGLTPVHGNHWTWLDNPQLKPNSKIFRAG